MPVEIKELIIRANIVNNNDSNSKSQNDSNSKSQNDSNSKSQNDSNSKSQTEGTSEVKEAIIAACVAQVLKILERKQER